MDRLVWNARICWALIQRDIIVAKESGRLGRRVMNTAIWSAFLAYVFEFIGLSTVTGCGVFIICAEAILQNSYRVFSDLVQFVGDLQGPRSFIYRLTLPIPQYLVFVTLIVSTALRLLVMMLPVLVVAKIVLGSHFDLAKVSVVKVTLISLCANFFYGTLLVFYASFMKKVDDIFVMRVRVGDILFWLGGFYFSWYRLYETSAFFAYLDLLNPLIYACEGMRAAVMGQEGYLNFWWCCIVLLFFTFATGAVGIRRMMKKLDCL